MSDLRKLRYALAAALLSLSWAAAPRVGAQPPGRRPTPNDTLKSTEVAPDHKVTFRIYAPKAGEVSVSGDFGRGGRMTKDDQGVWSLTVGPLTPDFYSYAFNVDGVKTIDPKNPMVKPGLAGLDNMFIVPGAEAEFETTRDVPHGEVRAVWYRSGTLGESRRMHVYTPPGYEGGSQRYPVFYLLHGGGDDDAGWPTIGRAGFILDNLIADGKAQPMLVVMPNGSLPRPANLPRPTPGAAPSPEFRARMEAARNRFTDELLKEVVPFVERTYRVRPGRENRALAGLSMGGGQTLRVVTTHPDQFAYVGVWSAGIFGGNADEWEKRNEAFLKDADKVNGWVRRFEVRVGDQDSLALSGSKALAGVLEKRGVKHEFQVSGGGHTWINWRHYLNELAPKLFRAAGPGGTARGPGGPPRLPDSVKLERDIPYAGTDNPRQKLDLLVPKSPKDDKPLPVIVFIHGGAWQGGDRSGGIGRLAGYVASGDYAGVTVGYRLSGEATWPAQIHDCKAAIRWVRANAAKYHLDPNRIGVIGSSAGGHLVAMLGTGGGVADLEGDLGPHKGIDTRVRCVVDEFGPADLLTIGDYPSQLNHNGPNSPEAKLLGGAIHQREDAARGASPVTYVSKDDPPFLIIHGDADPTVPYNQSERLYKALKGAGVDALLLRVEGGGHGGFRNPEVGRRTRRFFDRHLRGREESISDEPVPNGAGPATGFDQPREGAARGKVGTVEYDSKTVGPGRGDRSP